MIKTAPILVTGCPRSGTSIVAAVMNQCGAFLGSTSKRAMFENVRIHDEIVKPYFARMGVDIRGQFPLPDLNKLSIPINWKKEVEQVITDEGYEGGK